MDTSSLSHTRYKCQHHVVPIPKYRKRILYGRLKADVKEIIKKPCEYRKTDIMEGEEAVKQYIQRQKEESKSEDTRIASFRGKLA